MSSSALKRTLDRIAKALGISVTEILDAEREAEDGASDDVAGHFEAWANQVTDPQTRERLLKIALILKKNE